VTATDRPDAPFRRGTRRGDFRARSLPGLLNLLRVTVPPPGVEALIDAVEAADEALRAEVEDRHDARGACPTRLRPLARDPACVGCRGLIRWDHARDRLVHLLADGARR